MMVKSEKVESFHPFTGMVEKIEGNIVEVYIEGHIHKIQVPPRFADLIRKVVEENGSAWVQVRARYDYRGFAKSYQINVR